MESYTNQIRVNGKPLSNSGFDSFSSKRVVFVVIPVEGGYLVIKVHFYVDGRIVVTVKFVPTHKGPLAQNTIVSRFSQRPTLKTYSANNKEIKFEQKIVDEESKEQIAQFSILPEQDEPESDTNGEPESEEIIQKFKSLEMK
jgi:hypothetical protein